MIILERLFEHIIQISRSYKWALHWAATALIWIRTQFPGSMHNAYQSNQWYYLKNLSNRNISLLLLCRPFHLFQWRIKLLHFLRGDLDIFRRVYCPSQHPFLSHVRTIIVFFFPSAHITGYNRILWLVCWLLILSIFVLPTIFLSTFVSFASNICLVFYVSALASSAYVNWAYGCLVYFWFCFHLHIFVSPERNIYPNRELN
jgi:hypothetical protein